MNIWARVSIRIAIIVIALVAGPRIAGYVWPFAAVPVYGAACRLPPDPTTTLHNYRNFLVTFDCDPDAPDPNCTPGEYCAIKYWWSNDIISMQFVRLGQWYWSYQARPFYESLRTSTDQLASWFERGPAFQILFGFLYAVAVFVIVKSYLWYQKFTAAQRPDRFIG
jgi:hypothetical protein